METMKVLIGVFCFGILAFGPVLAGCVDDPPAPADESPASRSAWIEQDVTFPFDGESLFGVITRPSSDEPLPAVVLVSGSGDELGVRDGVSATLHVDHARALADEGFAVLRYDPPGVGRSTGSAGLPSLERRVDETLAAMRFLADRPETGNTVGLVGWSQGPWVMAMTAARHPEDVSFLISVVGSGTTVAEQQLYGIEAQSRDAGLSAPEVAKAVLFGRLLIDWQLIDPIYEQLNRDHASTLGDGPWTEMVDIVYAAGADDPGTNVARGIDVLMAVQDEPWAAALHLRDLYIPQFQLIPADITPEQMAAIQTVVAENLLMDPARSLTSVDVPVLAIFGQDDVTVDSERSAVLYRRYLDEAGNDDVTITVLPDVGHNISLETEGYWDAIEDWLAEHRQVVG